jgi:peptidoglycan/xylan/chitin deacetylase (PgdA/CDA1 family)
LRRYNRWSNPGLFLYELGQYGKVLLTTLVSIRKPVASLLQCFGVTQTSLKKQARGGFVILMYHRVLRPEAISETVQPGMYANVGTFEDQLVFLGKYFEVVSLTKLTLGSTSFEEAGRVLPRCALTFDDGWLDFFENVYPVLCRYQLPATIFLPTNYIGTTKMFWTDRLAKVLERGSPNQDIPQRSSSDPITNKIVSMKGPLTDRLEKTISLLKSLPFERIDKILTDLALYWGVNFQSDSRAFISWEEAKKMYQSGLVTFGSHTANHKILTLCGDEEVAHELRSSRERLLSERIVDTEFIPFCYPNGNFDARIANLVEKSGYHMAVTTKPGWNSWDSPLFSLRRIGIHQDMTSTDAMFGCRIAGIF